MKFKLHSKWVQKISSNPLSTQGPSFNNPSKVHLPYVSSTQRTWFQTKRLAQKLGLAVLETEEQVGPLPIAKRLPHALARRHRLVLICERSDGALDAAVEDPLNVQAIAEAEWYLERTIVTSVAPPSLVETLLRRAYEAPARRDQVLVAPLLGVVSATSRIDGEFPDLLDRENGANLPGFCDAMLREAIKERASDVHIEWTPAGVLIRYRIDGQVRSRSPPPKEQERQLLANIKLRSGLDIAECRRPQDGRMQVRFGGRTIDLRVSALPTFAGEKVALRILDERQLPSDFSALQLPKSVHDQLTKQLHAPQGLILVCGPTGSGKSTTLHCAMKELLGRGKNLMSIEDPVEFAVAGMSQLAVRPDLDLDFATGLRHLLRQDPDAILVGEIRDLETARIAHRAALTGHLILSTLHTSTARTAIARLLEMGLEPYVLAASVTGILAQRLVRQLCERCKRPRRASPSERQRLQRARLDTTTPLFEPKGCAHCDHSGYFGRRALVEWVPIHDGLREQILHRNGAQLCERGEHYGLQLHGEQLAFAGVTSLTEVQNALQGAGAN